MKEARGKSLENWQIATLIILFITIVTILTTAAAIVYKSQQGPEEVVYITATPKGKEEQVQQTQENLIGKWAIDIPTPEPSPTKPTETPGPTRTRMVYYATEITTETVIITSDQPTINFSCIIYAWKIEFFKDGTYAGNLQSVWNGGTYEILEDGRIKLSTVRNGLSVYKFSITKNTLTIYASETCTLKYKREN